MQVRVINAIKLWLETGVEFRDSAKLQEEVMAFINHTLKIDHPIHCRSLRNGLFVAKVMGIAMVMSVTVVKFIAVVSI